MSLEECTFTNIPSLNELIVKGQFDAKVLKVYDGDTVWVAYKNERLGYIKTKVRLNRIDAPEIKGNKNETKEEAQARKSSAEYSKRIVSELINGKIIKLVITGLDQYSRVLGDILIDEQQWLSSYIGGKFKMDDSYKRVVDGVNHVDLSDFMLYGGYGKKYS
jgi:endonuclease YncB( thermonuclease family)